MVAKKQPECLDNTWDNVPNPIVREAYNVFLSKEKLDNLESKRKKIELLKTQRLLSPIKRMVSCNRVPIAVATNEKKNESDIVATINVTKHGHYIEGMTTCDNGYCVHCSQTKKSKRAKKIRDGIKQLHHKKGYTGFFVTLTMPRSNDLKKQLDHCRLGWRNIQRRLDRENLEYETVKSYDITFSNVTGHGTYHLHIHSIFMIQCVNENLINKIIKSAWLGSVKNAELQCQDIQRIKCRKAIAEYTSKMSGLSYEIFNQSDKTTKTWKSKSLVELLELAGQNNVWAIKTYVDFIDTMKRKRTLTFSRNWPKEEEEEEEKDTVILKKLEVPLIWHRLIQNYYEDIGFLCTVGIELGGKIGNAFYETMQWYFESDSYLKIKNDILGCCDQYFYILIQDEILEVINEYYKKYMDILKTNNYTVA